MDGQKILREALEIAGAFSGSDPRRMDCEYYNGDNKRYCKCTTQTDCDGCRFYFPNSISARTIMAEYIVSLTKLDNVNPTRRLGDPYWYENQLLEELDESMGCYPSD